MTISNDIIFADGIKAFLNTHCLVDSIKVYRVLDSTNREAKEQTGNNAAHGTVIIADSQTHGRGRFDRAFFSPPGSGLYMSFVLSPNAMGFINPTTVTAYAAVRVCEAIESACGIITSVKWVNDIYLNGKKIGGILTEAVTGSENRGISKIVLGIGLNVSTEPGDFPEGIRPYASSLYPDGKALITRNLMAAEIINRILSLDKPKEKEIFEQYRNRLFMLGADVAIIRGKERYKAKALDIDGEGRLLVQLKDGEIRTLLSGEVSLI